MDWARGGMEGVAAQLSQSVVMGQVVVWVGCETPTRQRLDCEVLYRKHFLEDNVIEMDIVCWCGRGKKSTNIPSSVHLRYVRFEQNLKSNNYFH